MSFNDKNDSFDSENYNSGIEESTVGEPDYSDVGNMEDIAADHKFKMNNILLRKILIGVFSSCFLIFLLVYVVTKTNQSVIISGSNVMYSGDSFDFIPEVKSSLKDKNLIYSYSSSDNGIAEFEYRTLTSDLPGNRIIAKKNGVATIKLNVLDRQTGKKVGKLIKDYIVCNVFDENSFSNDNYSLEVGDELPLNLDLSVEDACYKNLKYESSNENIVQISSKGDLKGIGVGTATITVNNGVRDIETNVTVVPSSQISSVQNITLNTSSLTVNVGKMGVLTATITPSDATNTSVNWSSSNTSVATVSSKGEVVGVKAGNAVITATTQDGQKTAMAKVTVNGIKTSSIIKVKSIMVNTSSFTLYIGNHKYLKATVYPYNATNKYVRWNTSNASVAIVNNIGMVTGIKSGTAVITATTSDGGYKAVSRVTVKKSSVNNNNTKPSYIPSQTVTNIPIRSISFNRTIIYLTPGSTNSISYVITPTNATNKSLRWSSSNTSIVKVNSKGVVTGVRAGTATITASAVNGSGSDRITVQVKSSLNGNDNLVVPTITASDGISSNRWHKNNITLTASSSDSGVVYKWNNGYIGSSISISNEISGTIYTVKACKSNVCSSSRSYFVKLDKTSPSCNVSMKNANGEYIAGTISSSKVTITISNCSDNLSGMSSYINRTSTNYAYTTYPNLYTVVVSKSAVITILKRDNAGNVYRISENIYIK